MRKGFTLVEIMIVVAIIALLAAIAIPNLLRARLQANETSAQAAMKTLATAEITYRTANPTYGTMANLGSANPPYIDAQLAAGAKNGYNFYIVESGANNFTAGGYPTNANVSGVRSFCITEDGVVRVDPAGVNVTTRAICTALNATSP